MKFTVLLLGSQLLTAGLVLAVPIEQQSNGFVARSAMPVSPSAVQLLQRNDQYSPDEGDVGCAKLKRNAEAAAIAAAVAYNEYSDALRKRDDLYSPDEGDVGCAKLKRNAEASAAAASAAFEEYDKAINARKVAIAASRA